MKIKTILLVLSVLLTVTICLAQQPKKVIGHMEVCENPAGCDCGGEIGNIPNGCRCEISSGNIPIATSCPTPPVINNPLVIGGIAVVVIATGALLWWRIKKKK